LENTLERSPRKEQVPTLTLHCPQRYQYKELDNFAICKELILLRQVAKQVKAKKRARKKEKREQAPGLQTQLSTTISIAQIRELSRAI
jgi:hypothetical protein